LWGQRAGKKEANVLRTVTWPILLRKLGKVPVTAVRGSAPLYFISTIMCMKGLEKLGDIVNVIRNYLLN
jgi:hypothetical protein